MFRCFAVFSLLLVIASLFFGRMGQGMCCVIFECLYAAADSSGVATRVYVGRVFLPILAGKSIVPSLSSCDREWDARAADGWK